MTLRLVALVAAVSLAAVILAPGPAVGLDLSGAFVDDDGNPHEPNIEAISDAGITRGCGFRLYCPGRAVTRAEMASFLVRAFDLAPAESGTFDDIAGSQHAGDIDSLAAAGITEGCGPRRYCPDAPVRRDEMATFLARALVLAPVAAGPFTDVTGNPHLEDINAIAASGITLGCGAGRYCPAGAVARDQMASFLARGLELPPVLPRLSLSDRNGLSCTKDQLWCQGRVTIPFRERYRVSEGFFNVRPFAGGEEAALSSAGTRVELTVDGALVALTPTLAEGPERTERRFHGTTTLTPGGHRLIARWYWNGDLVQTTLVDVTVSG